MINLLYFTLNLIRVSQAVPDYLLKLFIFFTDRHSGILTSPNPIKISHNKTQISHTGKNTPLDWPSGIYIGNQGFDLCVGSGKRCLLNPQSCLIILCLC